MQKVLRQRTTVLPGGKVEIVSPDLEAGQTVEVEVRCPAPADEARALRGSGWEGDLDVMRSGRIL